jgi:glucosamine--fructose-6-phosphate aminotransferase (isomerizing)
VIYLEDGDVGLIDENGVRIFHQGSEVIRPRYKIPWTMEEAKRGGYEHFMLKEIHEQVRVLEVIVRGCPIDMPTQFSQERRYRMRRDGAYTPL